MNRRRGRPQLRRRINVDLQSRYFKPQGIPMVDLEIIRLKDEELEALRLKNIEGLDQRACAKKMDTSPATVQRILSAAYKKMSDALINGKAIKIDE